MTGPAPREITSQSHGDSFQNTVKGDDWFRGASDHARKRNSQFDIEAKFDRRLGIPTQVKVSGSQTFPLADARRWWMIDQDFRKVLGHWVQDHKVKRVHAVTEFIIHGRMMEMLRGRTSLSEVSDCHDAIRALRREEDDAVQVRERAKIDRRIEAMQRRTPWMTFNPKINRTNARLQASVTLEMLGRVARVEDRYLCHKGVLHPNRAVYTDVYAKRISLPHPIASGPRTFHDGSGGKPVASYRPVPDLFEDVWYMELAPATMTGAI